MGKRARYATPRQLMSIAERMTDDNALALEVATATGLRISDVLHLTKARLIPPDKISFTARKTGKKGVKTVEKALFDRLMRTGNRKFVFPSPRDGRRPRSRQAVWKNMRSSYRGKGRAPSPHSARQAYAVVIARREGIAAVSRELQHSHQDTTLSYALADMIEKRKKHVD